MNFGDPALVDHDVRDPGADIDERLDTHLQAELGSGEGPQHGESGEVDALDREPALLDGVDGVHHHLAGGRDQHAPAHPAAGVVGELLEGEEVEHRVLDGHGDEVLDLVAQGLLQLVLLHPGKVDLPHDHLLVGDADDHLLAAELRVLPELLDALADGDGVMDLTVAHGTLGERNLTELLEGDLCLAEAELGRTHPRRPDVETDGGSSCHDANLSRGGSCRT